jgi:hypothetical protein
MTFARALLQQRADRLALVEPQRGDVDQADDVRGIGAERRDDLAAVRVARDDRRAALAREHGAQRRDVVGNRAEPELRRGHRVAVYSRQGDAVARPPALPGAPSEHNRPIDRGPHTDARS